MFENGTVAPLTAVGEDPFESIDPVGLTARYGEPVPIELDAAQVEAALAPLTSERRTTYVLVRVAAAFGVAALVMVIIRRVRADWSSSVQGS